MLTTTDQKYKEDLYRTLARGLPNTVVFLFDRDLRYLIAEGAVMTAHGYSSDQFEGKTLYESVSPFGLELLEPLYLGALSGQSKTIEQRLGEHDYLITTQPVYNETGEVFAGMLVAQDITAFKLVQAELHNRVEQLMILNRVESELAAQLNIDYVLTMALDSAVRLSNADAGFIALIEGETWQKGKFIGNYPEATVSAFLKRGIGIIPRVVRQQQAELIEDVNLDPDYIAILPKTQSQIVVPLLSRDNLVGVLSLETSKAGHFTPQTLEFTRLMVARVAQAIDNARLFQQTADQLEELQGLYDRVSKLEQLKTDMIRIASHDLRNPLSVVLSYAGMLKTETGAKIPEYTENISTAAQQMRKIILNILSLERIEESAKNAQLEECDLKEIIESAFIEQRSFAALKSLEYTLQIDASQTLVRGDLMQLNEAMGNLISNAIKYTPENGAVSVSLTENGNRLTFKVVDNGYGIKEAQQSRLFQPFFRARTAETREIEGSGLGLHLVKNIIERHGGEMIFHSVYGEGSTFGFEMNLAL
jgi:signal transduction histidine kinase